MTALTRDEVDVLLTSLRFSVQRIEEWHAQHGKREWRDASVVPIEQVKTKLQTMRREMA